MIFVGRNVIERVLRSSSRKFFSLVCRAHIQYYKLYYSRYNNIVQIRMETIIPEHRVQAIDHRCSFSAIKLITFFMPP